MTPINVLNRSLISYTLCKRQRVPRNRRRCFGTEESQQCSSDDGTYCAEKNIPARPSEFSKANTKQVSFDLYKSGKTVAEIAAERHLAVSTIEGHLAYFIARRELDISDFLTKEQVDEIAGFFEKWNTESIAEAKAHFGERFLYGQLRMVIEHLKAKAV